MKMKTPKEIQMKVEEKRQEIKELSVRLRKEATESNICPNCGKPVPKNRLYCSDNCGIAFMTKYDYSQNSPVLREYKKQLKEEYNREHPHQERKTVEYPIARKAHKCWFCGLDIPLGEKYFKHTVVPGDEWFDEYPYQTTRYHITCVNFATYCVDQGIFGDDGIEEDEVEGLIYALGFESPFLLDDVRQAIRLGFGQNIIQAIDIEDYGGYMSITRLYDDAETDSDAFYVYHVSFEDKYTGKPKKEIFKLQHSLDDPEAYFASYISRNRGYDPLAIQVSIDVKSSKIPINATEMMK